MTTNATSSSVDEATCGADAKTSCRDEKGWRAQFGHPRGLGGWLVGVLMATKNRGRGEWVRALLEPRAEDRVLDIGCGPGVDVAALSQRVGYVAGVDVSNEMVRQSRRRNAKSIAACHAAVERAGVDAMPFEAATFDKVFSINAVQFWPSLSTALREIARVLRPGGLVAIAIQPRSAGADSATTRRWEATLLSALTEAGFEHVRSVLDERPRVPVVCCMGTTARLAEGAA